MEQAVPLTNNSARRNEDIALDLLKFVAASTGAGRAPSATAGFVTASASKTDEQATQLLDLYTKCLRAVQGIQGKGDAR